MRSVPPRRCCDFGLDVMFAGRASDGILRRLARSRVQCLEGVLGLLVVRVELQDALKILSGRVVLPDQKPQRGAMHIGRRQSWVQTQRFGELSHRHGMASASHSFSQ